MFESFSRFFTEAMEIPAARWVVYLTILLTLIVVAVYVIKFFRDQAFGSDAPTSGSLLSEIRKWKEEGVVDEEEFERVRAVVSERVQSKPEFREVKPDDRASA